MAVTLRPVDDGNRAAVLALRVTPAQQGFVATVEKSLAEVAADPALTAYAVHATPDDRLVGFAVTEVRDGVGFVLRVLVDATFQGHGYGRDLMTALVRRLRDLPDVAMVATSHRHDNVAMAALCRSLGFEPWDTPFPPPEGEVYLRLP